MSDGPIDMPAFVHECEVCGLRLLLTPSIAYDLGWDYPPRMGSFGVVSPRTCGACGIEGTVWYALAVTKQNIETVTDAQYQTLVRIIEGEKKYAERLLREA